jgi:EAL domain-containing protein (putative c-di-GMP-specific phosphodiesterase class I)
MAVQSASAAPAARLLLGGGIRCVYQPIVELASGRPVGYEALSRGPAGSALESPGAMFRAATEEGLLGEFDRACRSVAVSGALEAGLAEETALFVNAEPAGLGDGGVLDRIAEGGLGRISIVVELTERALASRPSEVLAAVRWLRERGCRIALDDVGIDPRSLGLMPFVSPEVIKLDRRLTQGQLPPAVAARVINAVRAEAERSGAVILGEGIETEAHRRRAEAMGAQLGQGWLFGLPGSLPRRGATSQHSAAGGASFPMPRRTPDAMEKQTPFELVANPDAVLRGDKRLLLSLSRQLEQEASSLHGESVVLATFQDQRFFSERMRRQYEQLARDSALVGVLGVGIPDRPGAGVRGASLSPADPLRGEWDVVVVGPHFAGAFVARDLGDEGCPDFERRFEYFMTYDRDRVTAAARALLHHLVRSD